MQNFSPSSFSVETKKKVKNFPETKPLGVWSGGISARKNLKMKSNAIVFSKSNRTNKKDLVIGNPLPNEWVEAEIYPIFTNRFPRFFRKQSRSIFCFADELKGCQVYRYHYKLVSDLLPLF